MVTNRLDWEKDLFLRILSLLESDLISGAYDALDLYEILGLRVEKALDESEAEEGASHRMAACASLATGAAVLCPCPSALVHPCEPNIA